MHLKSYEADFSSTERRWLPWLGATGKLRMGWSCWLNRETYPVVEKTFEGIANTRRHHLIHWADGNWEFLGALARQIGEEQNDNLQPLLTEWLSHAEDYSELFVVDTAGKVLASTCARHIGKNDLNPKALSEGLKARFLHGPYLDPLTQDIGPTSSKFHDAVTLMFYQPIVRSGKTVGCLCGRIPNDAMSDIIQREAGHVYRDSGDNYVFMVESRFDPAIKPGTALSRSRFEDGAFTGGDNLKSGVRTSFGTVKVSNHTELELRFTDPATNDLHPGVRETIRRGQNLFVTYPGYPDYRHIPVVGKGLTFEMPGSPDRWGMMCEGDLEEAYRRRPLPYRMIKRLAVIGIGSAALLSGVWFFLHPALIDMLVLAQVTLVAAMLLFHFTTLRPLSKRLDGISHFLLDTAECGGSLERRLDWDTLVNDEIGDIGRWTNSFVDKIDDTVSSVLGVAERVGASASSLSKISAKVAESSHHQNNSATATAGAVEQMSASIAQVSSHANSTEEISRNASDLSEEGKHVVRDAIHEMQKTAGSIADLSSLISNLDRRSDEISVILNVIKEIADQTNLLALNAAIEAARAGEQGRGFAVVADEVRKLAERTAQSTTQITGMVGTIQDETQRAVETMQVCRDQAERGVALAARAGESLEKINGGADHTRRMVGEIVMATREQSKTGADIAQNIEQIARMAGENNAQVQDASRAAYTLEQLATDLQKAVNKFSA
ncbi:MAG: methyl-accepting chemotaxis protein [Methylophilaceae bacterium]|nr:methyl-accepting chemotaxis protein [Methylophilaceae bacterium]